MFLFISKPGWYDCPETPGGSHCDPRSLDLQAELEGSTAMDLKSRASEKILLPLSTGLWGNGPGDAGQRQACPTGPMAWACSCWHPECRQPLRARGPESTREQASKLVVSGLQTRGRVDSL